jgi:PAS domain S-box-containing protein
MASKKKLTEGVTTRGGKNRDQYGRKFGKKQGDAMLEFTKLMWIEDAVPSLKKLLQNDDAVRAYHTFLKKEYNEDKLEFLMEANKLESFDGADQTSLAVQVYDQYIGNGGQSKGVGQQLRTDATEKLWNKGLSANDGMSIDPQFAMRSIREEADSVLKAMAIDSFPRFVKTPECRGVISSIQTQDAQLSGMLADASSKTPADAEEWLNMFVATAETLPACIVISDMCIPGAPMVYVNEAFCETTGYSRDEATGRNCRFLQGPDTEPEAIQVIRQTLSKGEDCHVKLTNYRKNGEKFQNLLTMRPVFDADNIYRFVIGVQFEIVEDGNLKKRLVQLDKLLHLLPHKLGVRSKASKRAKGAMAVKTTGEANRNIANKDHIVQQAAFEEKMDEGSSKGPSETFADKRYIEADGKALGDFSDTVYAFTKIVWLADPRASLRGLIQDSKLASIFHTFASINDQLCEFHADFCCKYVSIALAQGNQQLRLIKKLHKVMKQNSLFYCTANEVGKI